MLLCIVFVPDPVRMTYVREVLHGEFEQLSIEYVLQMPVSERLIECFDLHAASSGRTRLLM